MSRFEREAVILALIEKLIEKGSWCGETHIQKTTYFLEELLQVPLGFQFILYKHGPFSFDLSDELTAMRADSVICLESRRPYGPGILPGPRSTLLKKLFGQKIRCYEEKLDFIADKMAHHGVAELERLATAFYIKRNPTRDSKDLAEKIHNLKPHISLNEAKEALSKQENIANEAKDLTIIGAN